MEIKDLPLEVKKRASALKKDWTNIYCLKIKDDYIIVRPMTRGEFLFFLDMGQYMLGLEEEFVFSEYVLHPKLKQEDIDELPAGNFTDIVQAIIELSAFLSPEGMEDMIDK